MHEGRTGHRARARRTWSEFVFEVFIVVTGYHQRKRLSGRGAHIEQRLTDLGSNKGKISRVATTKSRYQREQLIQIVLRSKLEIPGLNGHASHDINQGAGNIKDFLDLEDSQNLYFGKINTTHQTNAVNFHRLLRKAAGHSHRILCNFDGISERHGSIWRG